MRSSPPPASVARACDHNFGTFDNEDFSGPQSNPAERFGAKMADTDR
jgi:hypothetical protein